MVFLQDVHYLSSGSFGRVLMPPPPPLFVAPGPVARKRPREATVEDRLSLPISTASTGMHFFHSWSFVRISVIICVFQCCLLHKMASPPMRDWGRSGRPVLHSHWLNQLTCFSCICFLSFPCFLSRHAPPGPACYGCVLWCHFIWSLPWLWIIRNQKLLLTWGSSMAFLFPLYPHPCLSSLVSPFLLCPYRCSSRPMHEEV